MRQYFDLLKIRRSAFAGAIMAGSLAIVAPQTAVSADAEATEGNKMEFTVKLNVAPNGWAVRYSYSTSDNSAVQSEDYDATSGTVTFNSGVKEKTISVDTIDDTVEEDTESFKLKLKDQQVNGLYETTGWVTPTDNIRGMPRTITLTGQITDND